MQQRVQSGAPTAEAIRSALEKLLGSAHFAASARASRFLRFLVETALQNKADTLKEYVLGVEVFDRGPAFDPVTDTIVRVEAVKLRKRLGAYYRGPGRGDSLIIEVPRGAYAPAFRGKNVRGNSRAARKPPPLSIAVLPFRDLSPGPENGFWSDSLTDELTSVLSRAPRLRVISRTSAFAFKGKAMDVREIGGQLGAVMVIEGSVRRHKSRVRIVAQLTEVATGTHLWSDTFECALADTWTVQQDVAEAVVSAVHLELTLGDRRRMSKRHTANPAAFELYLKGRYLLDRFEIPAQNEAMALFRQAAAADPNYPLPLLGIARCQMNLILLGVMPPKDVVPHAISALRRALAVDPELAEAHSLIASIISRHEWNWSEAEKHFQLALRLAPNAAEVHDDYATCYLAPRGRIEEALAENRFARQLDPYSPQLARSHAFILLLGRRLPDAEQQCLQILKSRPEDGFVRLTLALALHGQRRIPEALTQYERLQRDAPSIQHEAYVADIHALCGNPAPAQELLQSLTKRGRQEFIPAMVFVWLHLHLKQMDEALAAVEQAFQNREYELLIARVGYGFDAFREQPRFQALVEKLGLH